MKAPDVVVAIFCKENKILLQYRINTPRAPGHWGLPAGTVERGETGKAAITREMRGELNVCFVPEHAPNFSYGSKGDKRFDAYVVQDYSGVITNNEPQHCRELKWFELDDLPDPLTLPTIELLRLYRNS